MLYFCIDARSYTEIHLKIKYQKCKDLKPAVESKSVYDRYYLHGGEVPVQFFPTHKAAGFLFTKGTFCEYFDSSYYLLLGLEPFLGSHTLTFTANY